MNNQTHRQMYGLVAGRRIRQLITVGFFGFSASLATAAWDVRPVIKAEAESNDNVRLIENRDGGLVNTMTAQLASRYVADSSVFDLIIGGTYTNYDGVVRYDDTSAQFVRINGRRNTERGAIGLVSSARKDDYQRIYNQIGQDLGSVDEGLFLDVGVGLPPEGELDVNQEAIVEQIDRTRIAVKPYAEYQFSQRSVGRAYFEYASIDFEDLGEQLGLRDSDRSKIGIDYQYALSERNRMGVELSVGEFSPDNRDDIDSTELRIGWAHVFSPNLVFNIYAGAREVETGSREETGALFRVEADRRLQTGRFRLALERSLYPSSFGRIIQGDTVTLGYRANLTERFGFRFSIQAASIESDDSEIVEDNRDFASASPELIWKLSETASLHLGYSYRWIDREADNNIGLEDADSHAVRLGFEYHPRKRF